MLTRSFVAVPHLGTPVALLLTAVGTIVIFGMPWPASLFILAGIATGVATLRFPDLGVAALVLVIPVQAAWEGMIGTIHVTLTKTVFAGLVLGWIVHLAINRRAPRVTWLAVPYGGYVLVVLLSGLVAEQLAPWRIELYHWLNGLAVYIIAVDSVRSVRAAKLVILASAVGVISLSVYAFQQVLQHAGPPSFTVNGVTRAFGTFGQPNPFAGYLDVTVPSLLALGIAWWFRRPRRTRHDLLSRWPAVIVLVAAFLGLAATGATQSRGGWLAMVVAAGAVIWLLGGLIRLAGAIVVLALLASVLASPLGGQIGQRLSEQSFSTESQSLVTPENFAVRERLAHWRAGFQMAVDHPALGVGAGNFNARYREYTSDWRFRIPRGHAHNAYIHAAAQTGFIGFAGYLLLVGAVGVRLRQRLGATRGTTLRPLVVGAVGVYLAFAVHNVVDYLHVHNLPAQLGIVIALAEIPMAGYGDSSHTNELAPGENH